MQLDGNLLSWMKEPDIGADLEACLQHGRACRRRRVDARISGFLQERHRIEKSVFRNHQVEIFASRMAIAP
jgi:hypothetical protein